MHIRLNNYPDQEFGYVKGQVASISPAPTEEGMYIVEITLPDGMQTNYGKQLPVSRELKGTADIILADKNVLERLLAPLRKWWNMKIVLCKFRNSFVFSMFVLFVYIV